MERSGSDALGKCLGSGEGVDAWAPAAGVATGGGHRPSRGRGPARGTRGTGGGHGASGGGGVWLAVCVRVVEVGDDACE